MFDHIGKKIMTLSTIISAIGIALSVILGIILMIAFPDLVIIGLLIMALGIFISWVSSWMLYGYGRLIENSEIIAQSYHQTNKKNIAASQEEIDPNWKKPSTFPQGIESAFSTGETQVGTCGLCDAQNVYLERYKIKTNLGAKDRYICKNCIVEIHKNN